MPHPDEEERARKAREILDRVEVDSGSVGGSFLGRAAIRARDHLAAKDKEAAGEDRIEVIGTKIGRALSVVLLVVLVLYLVSYFT